MKEITKKVKTVITVKSQLKVPETINECNSLLCTKCAYDGNHITYEKCPHRIVLVYFEKEDHL